MLIDGLEFAAGSSLSLSSGTSFPSNPTDGQLFRLTQVSGDNAPGSYWYDLQNTTWVTGDIASVVAGTGLTGGGSRGDLTLELDLTYVGQHYVDIGGSTLTGPLLAAADPTVPMELATKNYVDIVAQGLDPKASVRAATTGNITLSGTQTVDGTALVDGDRVLVKAQTTASQNGIYVVHAGAWTRSTDADTSAKVTAGMFCFVEEGTTNGATGWNLLTRGATLGTTSLVFGQFGAAVSYTQGTNVVISGNTISVPNSAMIYDVAGSIKGKPAASDVVLRFEAVRAFTFPSGMTGSVAKAAVAATASTVLVLAKDGTQFGTLTFAAGGTSGTFAAASSTSFAAGNVLTVTAPATADSTFADCAMTFIATLV